MNYRELFEDEGFVYELTVESSTQDREDLYILSQGEGFLCHWAITAKSDAARCELAVTNDLCEKIVYHSVEEAVKGAKEFLFM